MNIDDPRIADSLDETLLEHYTDEGIESLYPPQEKSVEKGVTDGESLVAAVPTASGKTFIAQLGMFSSEGKSLYIVPLKALASEKYDEFSELPGVDVGISTGDYDSTDDYLSDNDVVVATSEKTDSLIRNGADWIRDVSCVVVDEVHLLDSGDRGPTLEVTLAKLRRLNPELQVIALSATVENPDEIAGWLDAELVETDWRPVDLRKGVYTEGEGVIEFEDVRQSSISESSKTLRVFGCNETRSVSSCPVNQGLTDAETEIQTRSDPVSSLVTDSVDDGGQCLVFVSSRRSAEATARRLSDLGLDTGEGVGEAARRILEDADTETGESLAEYVSEGVAFHHAGLTSSHRKEVEESFRARDIKVICATPTLAAGVNVPARRVIVRDHTRYTDAGMKPLPVLEVHQMFGRAGRPGLDPYGEAIVVASDNDDRDEVWERYIDGEPESVYSKLASRSALRTHVLSTVASGFAGSREELRSFLDATFYAYQEEEADLGSIAEEVIEYLEDVGMVEVSGDGIEATDLGHQVSRLYIDPKTGAGIVDVLEGSAETGFDPTPLTFLEGVCDTPDMYPLYLRKGDEKEMRDFAVKHEEEFVDPPSEFDRGFESWLASLKTARVLYDWIGEDDTEEIAEEYGVGPGDINSKVERADWLLHAAESIAETVGTDDEVAESLSRTRKRVSDGVREELLDLVAVRGIGRVRARRLYDAGFKSRDDLRTGDIEEIASLLGKKTAAKVVSEAGREVSPDEIEAAVEGKAAVEETKQSSIGDF
ncbi:DEAD/DEAH box helicase [Halorutilales archaeon Cl-col2-1]